MNHNNTTGILKTGKVYFCPLTSISDQDVLVDDSTPTSVGCSAGVVPTVAPLHEGNGEDIVCHCDSVTTSDR